MGRRVVCARRRSAFGTITIVRDTTDGSLRYSQGAVYQSIADSRGTSLAAYAHALAGFTNQIRAADILIIGCAGGTLGKLLDRRGRRITLIDINPVCFPVARQFFGLPDRIRCEVADGVEFVRKSRAAFDAVIVDVCDGTRLPAVFTWKRFLRSALAALRPQGYLLFNVIVADDADRTARKIAEQLAREKLAVTMLDTPGVVWRNALVVAGANPLQRPLRLYKQPQTGQEALRAELRAMEIYTWPGFEQG